MQKPRKQRSDSVTAAVAASQRASGITIPDHINLRPCDLPFFNAGLKSRDDWQEYEFSVLAQWARALADYEKLQNDLTTEGTILKGRINPKCQLTETLCRRAMALARTLQIHARAKRGEARDVARIKPAALPDDPDGLLA